MKKAFALAVLAYLVPTFVSAYLWHLVVFHDVYARLEIYRPEVIIPFGFGAILLQGLCFAWAYPRLFSTGRQDWAKSALRSGLFFALLSWTFTTLSVGAKNLMASVPDFLAIETGYTLLQFALVAPLMALAYRGSRDRSLAAGETAESPVFEKP